jgi:hypothetical protein
MDKQIKVSKQSIPEQRPVPMPDYGDLYTLGEFLAMVEDGALIDYDGSGYYADGESYRRDRQAVPSEMKKGKVMREFTHVAWFNK